METLGQFLKREREFRNITLDELCRATKLNHTVLGYIETDQWEKLPKGPYLKGLIKAYSRHLGLKEDEVLARLKEIEPARAP